MSGKPTLTLYNTLTRRKEAFSPIDADNVRMYVCGPTVYDFAHIGNARPVIVFDVLFRLLQHLYGEAHVTYVRNITDVDDKINARALRDFGDGISAGKMSLNEAIRNVTEKTAGQFHADAEALGCLLPTHEPRATEHIGGMVAMIQTLIDKGNAYLVQGPEGAEILFDIVSMPAYGALSNRKLDEQQAGARIDVKDHKKNPGDFVLWKESSAEQPGWEGRFSIDGKACVIHGRPGWHIECSVMSKTHLGEVFDIHGGGLDLIFPHHENEIAQSCCAHGTERMANLWMHNGYLQVEGRKMSKSEGNFVTIDDLLNTEKFGGRKWPGEVLRLAMLMTHYREPIDFSIKRLEEAESILAKWRHGDPQAGKVSGKVIGQLLEDLNTPGAIRALHALKDDEDFAASAQLLGILPQPVEAVLSEAEIAAACEQRLAFIREKNWAQADRIRDELLAQGVQLKDGKDPDTGERVTSWEVKR
ncbi:cysteine--tRNA ligase [Salaquimonas pukyongi]|uniref:cysteine--tRNA ligase n=1 Tax=Salaquimonas pukyongi TaxID=2712698 RepID=UPI00096B7257|nr:cysteine--tRNA ligase [Salaquimonas pukyongi]